jgi:hypothetical protein
VRQPVRRAGTAAATVALMLVAAGCGDKGSSDPDAGAGFSAADMSTCVADAQQVSDFPDGYPTSFPMPDGTVLYNVEDRGEEGVVTTGVTTTAFKDVLSALNGPAQKAGFTVTDGETEAHDAEANWSGSGYTGRWAIRESSSCAGETVIQLLSKKG